MTGGGIYPALAVHQVLVNKSEAILWIGSEKGLEENLLAPYNIAYQSIPGGGVHGMDIVKVPGNIYELIRGYQKAKSIVENFKPDVIFYTGGYIGVPMALAAKKVHSVVFIPDIEPGLALKTIMRFADRILVSTDHSIPYIKHADKVTVTGYPIRNEIKAWDRKTGRAHFGITPDAKVVLVFGGSKGAKSINDALIPHINALTEMMHIIHITGSENWEQCESIYKDLEITHPEKYHAYPFLHEEMGAAFAAADLVVCRAGASIIGELPYFGLPAILSPYPHAWRYQYQNADYLVSNHSAVLLEDESLQSELSTRITDLILDEIKLSTMKNNMRRLMVKDAANTIAEIIEKIGRNMKEGNNS
jgi:undecaprenyldiphospho-muramoylpentapeptide beta-N-acetylglucosaminyltransferase